MIHQGQNTQIETLSALALAGGNYSWNNVPISDAESKPAEWYSPTDVRVDPIFNHAPDPSFHRGDPFEAFHREILAAAQRRDSNILVEPDIDTEEWEEVGPDDALHASRVERKIVGLLDKIDRKRRRQGDQIETKTRQAWKEERDRQVTKRVSNDRRVAFDDVSPAMPLEKENLHDWHGWIYTKVSTTTHPEQRANLDILKSFLSTRGKKTFGQLNWREKDNLRTILTRIAQVEVLHEA